MPCGCCSCYWSGLLCVFRVVLAMLGCLWLHRSRVYHFMILSFCVFSSDLFVFKSMQRFELFSSFFSVYISQVFILVIFLNCFPRYVSFCCRRNLWQMEICICRAGYFYFGGRLLWVLVFLRCVISDLLLKLSVSLQLIFLVVVLLFLAPLLWASILQLLLLMLTCCFC